MELLAGAILLAGVALSWAVVHATTVLSRAVVEAAGAGAVASVGDVKHVDPDDLRDTWYEKYGKPQDGQLMEGDEQPGLELHPYA